LSALLRVAAAYEDVDDDDVDDVMDDEIDVDVDDDVDANNDAVVVGGGVAE
jgi:hypothetical protein